MILMVYCIIATPLLQPPAPYTFTTTLSKDQIWRKIVTLFTHNGISIKVVDKNSGIIQSEKIGLGTHCNAEGQGDSTAWALFNRVPAGYYLQYPQLMNGELMLSVDEQQGKTHVSIQLFNLFAFHKDVFEETKYQIHSTQVLEKIIADYLTHSESTLSLNLDDPFALFDEPKSQTDQRAADKARRQFSLDSSNQVADRLIKQQEQQQQQYPDYVEALASAGQAPQQAEKTTTWKDALLSLGLLIATGFWIYLKIKFPDEE
jgi:hypothetical protein